MTQPLPARVNPFIVLRILLAPVLWGFVLLDWQKALGIGIALAALTDFLDGRLAAYDPAFANVKLDSFADKLLTISVILWVILLRHGIFADHPIILSCAAFTFAASIFISWLKFQSATTLHLISGKLGGLIQAIFVVHAFWVGGYNTILFYFAAGTFVLAGIEEILVLLKYDVIDEDSIKSIVPFLNRQ